MSKLEDLKIKWQAFSQSVDPALKAAGRVCKKTGRFLRIAGQWIYKLRSVILAIPVGLAAFFLAAYNTANLPETVGIDLQATGEYAVMVGRGTATTVPLLITGVCLLLMFCSRRIVYPWIISVFTLVLPILIYVTNVFPA